MKKEDQGKTVQGTVNISYTMDFRKCHKHSLKLGLIGTNTREIENLSQRGCHTEKLVCLCLNIRENVEQGKSGHEGTLSNSHPMERL